MELFDAIQEVIPSWAAIAIGLGSAGAAYETVYSLFCLQRSEMQIMEDVGRLWM